MVRFVHGNARIWFYRNEDDINIYVAPLDKDGYPAIPAPISFRIWLRELS